jgi:hypothetical protein
MKNLDMLVKDLDLYLVKKAPALPKNVKEMLVKYAPWITILALVVSLQGLLGFLGFGSIFYYPMFGIRLGLGYTISMVFLAATVVLRGLSIKGLFARSKSGWNLVFYSVLVSAVYSLLLGDFVGLIVGTLISLYFTFQVREYYK